MRHSFSLTLITLACAALVVACNASPDAKPDANTTPTLIPQPLLYRPPTYTPRPASESLQTGSGTPTYRGDNPFNRSVLAQAGDTQIFLVNDNLCLRHGTDQPKFLADGSVVIEANLAPDGLTVAFTRGLSPDKLSFLDGTLDTELWLVNADGSSPRRIFDGTDFDGVDVDVQRLFVGRVDNFAWLSDSQRLLYTTKFPPDYEDAVHWVDVTAGESGLILPPGQGGALFPSPDGQLFAVARETSLRVYDLLGQPRSQSLTYPVRKGQGEGPTAPPEVTWLADSSGLEAMTWPANLFLDERTGDDLWSLWHLEIDSDQPPQLIRNFPGDYWGVRISSDRCYFVYHLEDGYHMATWDGNQDFRLAVSGLDFGRIEWTGEQGSFVIYGSQETAYLVNSGGEAQRIPNSMPTPQFEACDPPG